MRIWTVCAWQRSYYEYHIIAYTSIRNQNELNDGNGAVPEINPRSGTAPFLDQIIFLHILASYPEHVPIQQELLDMGIHRYPYR